MKLDAEPNQPLLQMDGIRKSFGATRALKGVSLEVHAGAVLALIGENGAGKSTLMKTLSGAHSPDAGTMYLDGQPYAPSGPHAARLAGVAMIYQELNLAPDLSVEDNIMLGRENHRLGWLDRGEQRRRVREALDLLGHPELQPQAVVGTLSIGAQQLVEIARALVFDAKVIVFDEPTSSLPRRDVDRLFDVVRRLRESGLGIVYISHFLEEIREVADTYSVLRDGETAGVGELTDTSDSQIISLMVGRSVDELFPRIEHELKDEIVALRDVTGRTIPVDVSFSLRQGEIFGVAGLVGAGRTELLRCIFGLDEIRSGSIEIAGLAHKPTPRDRIRAGFGYVSEDRKSEGLAQGLSITDNLTLSWLRPYAFASMLNLKKRRAQVEHWMQQLDVKAYGPDQEVNALSGGNQQKVALARVMHQDADILLLDEPTRGIDVGTKSDIYRLMGQLAADGKAIVFVSSYVPELLGVCDRIGVMARGRMREIRDAAEWTEESVLSCAVGTDG